MTDDVCRVCGSAPNLLKTADVAGEGTILACTTCYRELDAHGRLDDDRMRADGGVANYGTVWDDLARGWATKAGENVEKWGEQDVDTLLLAAQEELGELTQARLEARAEDGDPRRVFNELADLAALMFQIHWTLEYQSTTEADR